MAPNTRIPNHTDERVMPAASVPPEMAKYILSLPSRSLGNWDNNYIRAVTGVGWETWSAVFQIVPEFESVLRTIETDKYLRETGRLSDIVSALGQSGSRLNESITGVEIDVRDMTHEAGHAFAVMGMALAAMWQAHVPANVIERYATNVGALATGGDYKQVIATTRRYVDVIS